MVTVPSSVVRITLPPSTVALVTVARISALPEIVSLPVPATIVTLSPVLEMKSSPAPASIITPLRVLEIESSPLVPLIKVSVVSVSLPSVAEVPSRMVPLT